MTPDEVERTVNLTIDRIDRSRLEPRKGLLLLIAGVSLFVHQAIAVRRLKRGRIHAEFNLRNVSIRSIYCVAIVIAIGIILVGIGAFGFEN
jgi:ribosomal protein S26